MKVTWPGRSARARWAAHLAISIIGLTVQRTMELIFSFTSVIFNLGVISHYPVWLLLF
jgi:hypothetical protein